MKTVIKSDLTVVGAGFAGICVAIAGARQGLTVTLVNDRLVLGGNASSEHRIHVNGGATGNNSLYGREGGIADELKLYTLKCNPLYNKKQEYHLCDMSLFQKVKEEKNITCILGATVYDCECENNKITKAFAVKAMTGEEFVFESDFFCDASGDGILGFKAGCEYRMGREPQSMYNESLAPEKSDNKIMGSCILFSTMHTGTPVKYKKPDFAYDLVKDDKLKYFDRPETGRELPSVGGMYNGLWWLEYASPLDTIKNSDDIDLELKKLIYGYWDYIKNSGNYPDAEDMVINWIAPYASKRESRRFMGEYILKQSDIQNSVDFDDAVSTGGWSIDVHDIDGIYGNDMTSSFGEVDSIYNIPYSIMYSKDKDNLFLAGRITSCSHIAMGSTRVMQTLGAMGHAVGVAASLCKKYNATPSQIRHNHIGELQKTLQKDGQFILGIADDIGKVKDANITVSSVKTAENIKSDKEFSLSDKLIFAIPVSSSFTKKIDIKIKNKSENKTVLKYKVFDEKNIKTYSYGKLLFENSVEIESGFDDYVSLPIDIDTTSNKLFIEIEKNTDLSVFGNNHRVTGVPSAFGHLNNVKNFNTYSYCFKGIEEKPNLYCKENILNGFSRPYGKPNCWISENKENQYLELNFKTPVDVNNIQIYFNAQFESEHFDAPISQLITDYKMTVSYDNGKQYSKTINDNCLSRNSFDVSLKDVASIRFDFIQNNGAENFEVFSVKVF